MTSDPAFTGRPGSALPVPLPLVTRTVAVDASAVPADLLDLLPREGGLAWLRRGDGLVAWGEVARIETSGPGRFLEAERAWRATAAHAWSGRCPAFRSEADFHNAFRCRTFAHYVSQPFK